MACLSWSILSSALRPAAFVPGALTQHWAHRVHAGRRLGLADLSPCCGNRGRGQDPQVRPTATAPASGAHAPWAWHLRAGTARVGLGDVNCCG